MGTALYGSQPVLRETIDACSEACSQLLDVDIAVTFRAPAGVGAPATNFIHLTHPELDLADDRFRVGRRLDILRLGVLQLGLCDLWRSLGIYPYAALGISLGEVGAAYAAGVLSLPDAATLLCGIADGASRDPAAAVIFTVGSAVGEALELCAEAPRRLQLMGAIEPDQAFLVSRMPDADVIESYLREHTAVIRGRPVAWAYHTIGGMVGFDEFSSRLGGISPREPTCPVYSAAAGGRLEEALFDAKHWHWMVARPFHFDRAVAAALSENVDYAVAIGPHPDQERAIRTAIGQLRAPTVAVASMRRDTSELDTWASAVRTVSGKSARWRRRAPRAGERRIDYVADGLQTEAATIRLDSAAVTRDPFRHYRALMAGGPVQFLALHEYWLVLGYEQVRAVLSQPQRFSSSLIAPVDPVLLGSDGPPHARVRSALSDLFGPDVVGRLTPALRTFAKELVAPLGSGDELEVVRCLAAPLAYYTAALLLELDEAAASVVRSSVGDGEIESLLLFERLMKTTELLVRASAVSPRLRAAGSFSDEQLGSLMRVLWTAATSTTKRVVASSIRLLIDHPQVRDELVALPSSIDAFIEESLRLHPPELLIGRTAVNKVTLAGVTIPEGAVLQLAIGAANRDPSRFVSPDELRLDRSEGHIAFGFGSHGCPGAVLARAQAHAVISALLDVAPEVDSPQPACMLRYLPKATTHGLEQLVITPGPR
jgi:cytochrome P450